MVQLLHLSVGAYTIYIYIYLQLCVQDTSGQVGKRAPPNNYMICLLKYATQHPTHSSVCF